MFRFACLDLYLFVYIYLNRNKFYVKIHIFLSLHIRNLKIKIYEHLNRQTITMYRNVENETKNQYYSDNFFLLQTNTLYSRAKQATELVARCALVRVHNSAALGAAHKVHQVRARVRHCVLDVHCAVTPLSPSRRLCRYVVTEGKYGMGTFVCTLICSF